MDDLEQVAIKLDAIARRRLPDGVIQQGLLRGCEAEIRQEALIMTAGGFLQRNTATNWQSPLRIRIPSARRWNAAWRSRCRSSNENGKQLESRTAKAKPITEENGGTCEHPAQHQPDAWPPDVKAVVIMRSVMTAVNQGQLSVSNATIVYMICERGMTVEQVRRQPVSHGLRYTNKSTESAV